MRKIIIAAAAMLLTACQTMPQTTGFNAEQTGVLVAEGFVPVEENYELGLSSKVLFGFDKSELNADVASNLARMTKALLDVNIGGATIEGHTDNQGAHDYNTQLSLRRADTVKSAFVAGGMDPAAIRTIGLGETDPIEDNATEEGRSENRRVVVIVSPGDVIGY